MKLIDPAAPQPRLLPVGWLKLKGRMNTKMFVKFLQDETGLELSEYAVAAALVALAAIVAFQTLGANISTKITDLAGKIQ